MKKFLEVITCMNYSKMVDFIGAENSTGQTQLKDGRKATVRQWSGEGYIVSFLFDENDKCLRIR